MRRLHLVIPGSFLLGWTAAGLAVALERHHVTFLCTEFLGPWIDCGAQEWRGPLAAALIPLLVTTLWLIRRSARRHLPSLSTWPEQ